MLETIILTLVGLVVGAVLADFAARRTVLMPTRTYEEFEEAFLLGVLAHKDTLSLLSEGEKALLSKEGLTRKDHKRLWEVILLNEQTTLFTESIINYFTAKKDEAVLAILKKDLPVATSSEELKLIGKELIEASKDLGSLEGSDRLEESEDPDGGFVRIYKKPSKKKVVLTALATAFGFGVVTFLAPNPVLITVGLITVAASIVIALIDIHTLLIDTKLMYKTLLVIIPVLGIELFFSTNDSTRLLGLQVSALFLLGASVLVWFLAFVFEKLRGKVGLGRGDLHLLLLSLWVPMFLARSLEVALWGLAVGVTIAATVGIFNFTFRLARRDQAAAFGPYLVAGWIIAWPLLALIGSYSQTSFFGV